MTRLRRWLVEQSAWHIAAGVMLVVAIVVTLDQPSRAIAGDARTYVEAASSLSEGSYSAPSEPSGTPRYPPGFPILLAPAVMAFGDAGARAVSTVIGVCLVTAVWALARHLGGDRAAVAASTIWAFSPMVNNFTTDVMSDPAAALFSLCAALAAARGRWALAGLALAWSTWIRIIHVTFLGGLGRNRRAWAVAAVALLPLVVFQLAVYGRLAGYDGAQAGFSFDYVFERTGLLFVDRPSPWANWQFVPGVLFGLSSGLVPMLPVLAAYEAVRSWADPAVRLGTWVVLANVLVYLPYYFQAARFMLPAACFVIAGAAAGLVRAIDSVGAWIGGVRAAT